LTRRSPRESRARDRLAAGIVVALLAASAVGCSWLVGVTGDPVISDGIGSDASDEAAAAETSVPPFVDLDADQDAADAAGDVAVE
jgi:hypothetical protein